MSAIPAKAWEDLDRVARSRGTTLEELISHIANSSPEFRNRDGIDLNHPNDMMQLFYALEALPGVRVIL